MQRCSCIICKKEYSCRGFHTHYSLTHTIEGRNKYNQNRLTPETKLQHKKEYICNPKRCKYCNTLFGYEKRNHTFCNASCSAKFNNQSKVHSEETKRKISQSAKNSVQQRKRIYVKGTTVRKITYIQFALLSATKCRDLCKYFPHWESIHNNSGPYSTIIHNKCKHCSKIFCHGRKQKYCNDCNHLYSDGRNKYLFTFNLFHYPDLFDLEHLKRVGFYQRNAKDKDVNKYRLTRDHKVTVNEAIRNNYNTYYITHPLNCELLTWIDNNKKNTNSSITYEHLVEIVNQYDLNR